MATPVTSRPSTTRPPTTGSADVVRRYGSFVALFLATAWLGVACAYPGNDVPESARESLPADVVSALESAGTSEYQLDVLRDGVVTYAEYERAHLHTDGDLIGQQLQSLSGQDTTNSATASVNVNSLGTMAPRSGLRPMCLREVNYTTEPAR